MAALMNPGSISSRTLILRWSILAATVAAMVFASVQNSPKPANAADELAPGSPLLIQPEELVQAMKARGPGKPVVLYVGPKSFYLQAHIPGTDFVGPVGPEHLEHVRARIAPLPKDAPVVIYCGCCPWDHCPNIRPAFAELQKEGFTHVRVLYLANNFGTNWKDKGFPVASGE
jgi:thiosulfate/3-mercaptopyruvate sulfurtransferase